MRVICGSYGVICGRGTTLDRTVICLTPDFTNVKSYDFSFREEIQVKAWFV